MSAPKRGQTPHHSQPKMRKLDEDGDTLPTKIESATNSLITEKKQENTAAAPRTKIKRLLVEKGNKPAISSKQSSPTTDSSNSPPDPPVKKAKLLIATSASCGEAPSQRANSKASLKRTTSTESDEDLSSDDSKVDLFKEKDDEDEARCIRKYSNKAKRKVEESSFDPQETSQDLSSSPLDPVQVDHNYGRFSDSTSLQNTGEVEDKDSTVSFLERESQELSHDATQKVPTDTSASETGSTEMSIKVESANDEHKDVELQYQESPTLLDNKTPAFSREMADCVTHVGEKKEKDETESIKSQKDADNKTLTSPEKTLSAVTGELISGSRVVDERTDLTRQSESQTCLTIQSVSEENELNIRSKTKEQEVFEVAGICADKLDKVLLNVTSSVLEHVEISRSDSQPKENVKMVEFTSSNTQIDLSCQVALREEFDASDIQAEMPENVVSLCDVNKTLEKFEENPRGGVDFESPQTSACSEVLVEVHLNHGDVTPDSCIDTLSECVVLHEETQVEMLSDHLKVPEGQKTPEAVLQSEENCLFNGKVTKVATLAEGDSTGKEIYLSSVQCSVAEIKADVHTSIPNVAVKIQDQDDHDSITNFHEAHSAKKFEPLENEETGGAECGSEAETQSAIVTQTVVTPEISNSDPPVETRNQENQEVSESTTVTSIEIHSNVTAAKCENVETVECVVIAEGQSGGETHLVATFKLSDSKAKVELQIQESPVNEHTTVVLEEGEKDPENANFESRNDGECVDFTVENLIEVDKQNAIMSEEVCIPIEETHSQINQEVSEHTIDIPVCDKAQKVVENANCATQSLSPSQIKVDVLAAVTSEEVSNIAHIREIETPMVSGPTTETFIKVQKELKNGKCAAQRQIKVVDDVQAAATSEKVSNMAPIVEQMQISVDREPITDAPDDAYTNLENAAFKSSKDVKCVSAAAQSQIEVGVDNATSEKVSKVAPIEELQNQIVSEPTMHTSVKFMGYNWKHNLKTFENNEFKFDSPTVIRSQMEVDTTLAMESSSPTPSPGVNKNQTEEDMQAPEKSSSTAFVVETQTLIIQDVSGQTRDVTNKELHENIVVENLQKVKSEVNSGHVTVQEHRLKSEIQVTPASVVLEGDCSVEIQKSPNEMHVQNVTTEQGYTFPAVEIQNLKSHDVIEEHIDTWSVADEESQNKMETTETSVLSPSAETQYQINNDVNESLANVPEQVQANESLENENKAIKECVYTAVGINKMETQSVEGLQENSQPMTTKQIPSQRGQEVCELTTDTNILVLQSSSETQIQKGFIVTDYANEILSETVQESFTIPSTEDHENKIEVVEDCINTAEMRHETETKTPQMLEVSQPTTSENSQIQRGQELSELTTDISVSPPPPETQIQRTFDVTEPSSEVSKIVQEDFKIHTSEDHENENKEYICASDGTYKMEIQTAEELQEILQPTTEQRDQEATELGTDISASPPSSEIHIQKNINITESATNTSVCNENTVVEKSLGTTERTIEMEMQAAEMLLEVSQPATAEQSQNLKGQEVCELTTDISFSPSSSETEIQKSINVTDPANDVSETVQESFSVPLNQRHENEVLTECGNTAERINKMETQSVQMLEEVSQGTIPEQVQNQRVQEFSEVTTDPNLSVSPVSAEIQIHTSLDVTEAATNTSETVQETFTFSSSECREKEMKTFEKCADSAEMTNEMEMQTTEALEETFQPTTTEQTQNQRGQKVIELTVDTNIFVIPPLGETTIQKSINITEPASDISKPFQESVKISPSEINKNKNRVMKECVHTAEKTNKMETQPPELLQEISQPTITEQNQINDSISTKSEQNKNYVTAPENHPKIDMQTSLTPEIYYQKSDVELQNQRNTDVSEEHKIEEMDASECENVPAIETNMEASAKSEISYLAAAVEHPKHLAEETTEHTMHVSDEILTPQPIVNVENENDGQTEPESNHRDAISGLIERADSALEEAIKVEASVRNAEGGAESSEVPVILFVCDQSDDTDIIQAPEEQIKTVHQSEVEFYENQVVYEPISSPESNSGGEVCTPIQLGETISFLDLQSAETHHLLGEKSNFLTRDDKSVITHPKLEDGGIVKDELFASDCRAAVLMEVASEAECPAHAHLEQSNKLDNVTHIAAINSSDSSVTDGRSQSASKQGERCDNLEYLGAAELTEQIQEDTEVQDATVILVTTPASTEIEITDVSSEQMQEDTGVQDATANMATETPASTEVEITDASSEQVQEDTGFQDAIDNLMTTTTAPTEAEVEDASSEQVQEDTGVQDATANMATETPASTETEITNASSEQMQEDIKDAETTSIVVITTPIPTEVEITDASSEPVQEDTGVQDATAKMATETPASTEVEITDASSEQMQEDIEDAEATSTVVITTPAPTEVEITDALSEPVQEDTGVQDATAKMATTTTTAQTEVEITDASSEQVQEDTGVQDATANLATTTTPAQTEAEIIDTSSEQVQEDTGVQDATAKMATTTAQTEVEITDASSEQVQEDIEDEEATANMATTTTPAQTEAEITDTSSEQVQEDIEDEEATGIAATTTPAPTEVEITDASSEQVQEDTGVQDATTNVATATPSPIEFQITDASSEQMQKDIEDEEATGIVVITPAPTEVEITDASFEQVQEDTGVQDTTDNMAAATPARTEVEVVDASSEQMQEETGFQNTTADMVAATPGLTEVEITDASSEQMEEDVGVKEATTNMATATPALTKVKIIDALSEQVQEDIGVQDATVVMATASSAPIEFQTTDASSEQVQEDTGVQDATVIMATATPASAEVEITDAPSEQLQEDTGVQDDTVVMATTTPAPTEGEVADASANDFVILEPVPVPESEIHFDIVTRAVAESGLSASLGPDEEIASQSMLNSSLQTIILEAVAPQGEPTDEVNETTVTSSDEVLEQETETNRLQDAPVSDHQLSSASVDVEMANSHHTNHDGTAAVMENVECTLDQDEEQILEVMEIGREVVVAEEDNEEDSDVIVIKPPAQPTVGAPKSEEQVNVTKKQDASKPVKKRTGKVEQEKGRDVVKPKKQEMNMQARTKARLAALAEQKAAAAKRSANRQQLNLLALCQEIAEDIATDSMLLKKIEEEKQAAAAAEAAKAEAIKKESPSVTPQEAEPDNVVTPAGPEESPASETPTPELPAVQPSTADPAETKPAAEPPKRRFFTSQISVPLKAHEKKKLTRYQRLRQVELQREKMSWARVKKLKSDQTNQMFSDMDWQASFSGGFFTSSAAPPKASSPSKTPPVSQTTASQPAQPKGDSPKSETPTYEIVKTGVVKTEPTETQNSETELVKTEPIKTEPAKAETSKAEPIKVETTKTEAPSSENRRITRQSKAQVSKAAVVAPKPAPKVTRSASKRSLPAVPPPMPNGLNAQKPKPVEYKPYRPRPKYSFDDFELDDDDSLLVSQIKPNLSTQPPRPSLQPRPTAQFKPPLKPTISSQPANQAKLKSQTAPPGPTRPTAAVQAQLQSAKPKPTVTAAAQLKSTTAASSKPVPSTSTQLKTPISVASQSKPASAQLRPAAAAPPQLKPAGVNVTKQFAPAAAQPNSSATTETKPAAAKTGDASVPRKTESPQPPENGKCKNTADPLSSLPASSLPSVESTDDTKRSDKSPADTAPNSSAEDATKTAKMAEKTSENQDSEAKPQAAATFLSDASLQKEVKKLKEADKDGTQTVIDAGQKHFGPVACSGCGMLYSAANPEDESQHLLFHNQFISAVKYVGWKKERILAEYPDGKIILVLPDDPKYALKKVEEIREMVDNDLGFQQVETKCPSQTKTFLFISIDKKVAGCLIAEHIQEGYRVIEETLPEGSEGEKMLFERQKAWCCSTTPDPAICGISRIWVVSMMRRRGIATRMIECLRNNFIYGSYLRKDEIAFSDPTPDGKLFASHYFGTSQFLVYNFVSGLRSFQPKTQAV